MLLFIEYKLQLKLLDLICYVFRTENKSQIFFPDPENSPEAMCNF